MENNSSSINDDGEYIPEKSLNTSFKIPKKNETPQVVENVQTYYNYPQTQVLDNTYYDYNQTYAYGEGYDPQTVFYQNMIYNQIIQEIHKEKPKKYDSNILKKTIPDIDDTSLPHELRTLFQPLYCKLCTAQLSSNVNAKLHYSSKNHEKKIRKYLVDYSERTGEPLHKRARIEEKPRVTTQTEEFNPRHYHCDICDLPLTGKAHAESHYMGKNHQKVLMGQKHPAGRGYYNQDGKWVREHKVAKGDGQDNFGLDFRYPAMPPLPPPPPPPSTTTTATTTNQSSSFRCELCSISTTCYEQLESHYKGHKHQKKLKQLQKSTNASLKSKGKVGNTILSSILYSGSESNRNDLSVYRTPSGNYYCQICNISVNSEPQLRQHFESKCHLKKATAAVTATSVGK